MLLALLMCLVPSRLAAQENGSEDMLVDPAQPGWLNRDEVVEQIVYPQRERVMGYAGRVVLRVRIDENGAPVPGEHRVLRSPHPELTKAFVEVVDKMRFTNPQDEEVWVTVPHDFTPPKPGFCTNYRAATRQVTDSLRFAGFDHRPDGRYQFRLVIHARTARIVGIEQLRGPRTAAARRMVDAMFAYEFQTVETGNETTFDVWIINSPERVNPKK